VLTLTFLHLVLDADLLELRKIIDKHLAQQVIHLMLDADSQQAFGFQRERLAVAIQCLDRDFFRPRHRVINTWHRQTAFFIILRTGFADQFRVDEDLQILLVFADIDDDDLLVHIDLSRCKADAGRGIHGLRHVVDQTADSGIDLFHRLGDGIKPRVGVIQDV